MLLLVSDVDYLASNPFSRQLCPKVLPALLLAAADLRCNDSAVVLGSWLWAHSSQ